MRNFLWNLYMGNCYSCILYIRYCLDCYGGRYFGRRWMSIGILNKLSFKKFFMIIYHLFFFTLIVGPFLPPLGSNASPSSSSESKFLDISQNSFDPNLKSLCGWALYQKIWSSNLLDFALLWITGPYNFSHDEASNILHDEPSHYFTPPQFLLRRTLFA